MDIFVVVPHPTRDADRKANRFIVLLARFAQQKLINLKITEPLGKCHGAPKQCFSNNLTVNVIYRRPIDDNNAT